MCLGRQGNLPPIFFSGKAIDKEWVLNELAAHCLFGFVKSSASETRRYASLLIIGQPKLIFVRSVRRE